MAASCIGSTLTPSCSRTLGVIASSRSRVRGPSGRSRRCVHRGIRWPSATGRHAKPAFDVRQQRHCPEIAGGRGDLPSVLGAKCRPDLSMFGCVFIPLLLCKVTDGEKYSPRSPSRFRPGAHRVPSSCRSLRAQRAFEDSECRRESCNSGSGVDSGAAADPASARGAQYNGIQALLERESNFAAAA